jgi:hypothetical protein
MSTSLISGAGTGAEAGTAIAPGAGTVVGAVVGLVSGLFKKKHYLYYLFTWDAGAGKWISQGTSMDPDGIKATAKVYNGQGIQTSINTTGIAPAPLAVATGLGSSKTLIYIGLGIVGLGAVYFVLRKK